MLFVLLLTAIVAAQDVCEGCGGVQTAPTPEQRLDAIETELAEAQESVLEALQLLRAAQDDDETGELEVTAEGSISPEPPDERLTDTADESILLPRAVDSTIEASP